MLFSMQVLSLCPRQHCPNSHLGEARAKRPGMELPDIKQQRGPEPGWFASGRVCGSQPSAELTHKEKFTCTRVRLRAHTQTPEPCRSLRAPASPVAASYSETWEKRSSILKPCLGFLNRSALVSIHLGQKVCDNLQRTAGSCLFSAPSPPPTHLFAPSPVTDSLSQGIEAASYQSLK